MLKQALSEIQDLSSLTYGGFVKTVVGLLVEVTGIHHGVSLGSRCSILSQDKTIIEAEVVGFKGNMTLLMAYDGLDNVGPGCEVSWSGEKSVLYPHSKWLGRLINGLLGMEPSLEKQGLKKTSFLYPLKSKGHKKAPRRGL